MYPYRKVPVTILIFFSLVMTGCTCRISITRPPQDGEYVTSNSSLAARITGNCADNCEIESFHADIDGQDVTTVFTCTDDACSGFSPGLSLGSHTLRIDTRLYSDTYQCRVGSETDQRQFHVLMTEQWARRYNGPGNGTDYANAIAVDPSSGNVYVTGYDWAVRDTTYEDYATVAYDSSGNELWVARYDGLGGYGADYAWAIAFDPSTGNVYVTGWSYGSGTGLDYATVAYDSGGNELWVARYDGLGGGHAFAIAVDPSSGRVYVTGGSYATVAYDSGGNEQWARRYNGPGNGNDYAKAIAVDPSSGSVYVTGGSEGSGTYEDYATVAYDSGGNELWVARYNGPASLSDVARAIAVDPSTGNVYVTGFSYVSFGGTGWDRDYATVKY